MPRPGELYFVTAHVSIAGSESMKWPGTGSLVYLSLHNPEAKAVPGLHMQTLQDNAHYFFQLDEEWNPADKPTIELNRSPLDPLTMHGDIECTENESIRLVEYQFSTSLRLDRVTVMLRLCSPLSC